MTDRTKKGASPLSLLSRAPIPLGLLNPALDLALSVMHRRHPSVFERLEELGDPLFLIDPSDLPMIFLLRPVGPTPSLKALADESRMVPETSPAAAIRGPLARLIDLLEGRIDGDALFFNRELVIEGDTEAVLLMRNAVDSDEVDLLEDLLSQLGPLARPARGAADNGLRLIKRFTDDLAGMRQAFLEGRDGRGADKPQGKDKP